MNTLPTDLKITEDTPIREFCDQNRYYNKLIDELNTRINELNTIVSEKDQQLENMRSSFNAAINALRSEYLTRIAELNTRIENNQ